LNLKFDSVVDACLTRGYWIQRTPLAAGEVMLAIRLDTDVLDWFRSQVEAAGGGNYRTLINAALREHIENRREPLEETLRRVLREELRRSA
jgi:hypothetical protein